MLAGLTQFIKILSCTGLCYLGYLSLKLVVTILICRHPELSDEKVKYITRMIAKDRHQAK